MKLKRNLGELTWLDAEYSRKAKAEGPIRLSGRAAAEWREVEPSTRGDREHKEANSVQREGVGQREEDRAQMHRLAGSYDMAFEMIDTTTSAPAIVLSELANTALGTSGTAAGSVATIVFSGLALKEAVSALLTLVGLGGLLVIQDHQAPGTRLLAAAPDQVETEAAWGEAVEGMQARLRVTKTNWNVGATPRLFVDVRNQGARHLLVQTKQMHGCEVEVDGRWFQRPANTLEIRALPSPFPPGRQYDGVVVNLDDYWQVTVSQDVRRSRRRVPERLRLTPGQHTIRVAVTATADKSEPEKSVRAVSNPVKIEIMPARGREGQPR